MPMFRKLATLATAAEAARRYARKNPDKTAKFVDQAARFVDKQTKGKYSGQITGAATKAKNAAGIKAAPGATGNGFVQGYDQNAGYGTTPGYGQAQPGQAHPGTPKV